MERLNVQLRAATVEGNTLKGYAHVFGTTAQVVRGHYERFAVGAFDKVLTDPTTDVRAFWQHDPRLLLGRQGNGTVRIEAGDDTGLPFEIDLPNTSYASDLRELVDRGDLETMSFGFIPGEVRTSRAPDGLTLRTHTNVRELVDISPVSIPAFTGTSVSLGPSTPPAPESPRSQAARARARVHLSGDQ